MSTYAQSAIYWRLFHHWYLMAFGRSYWHLPQAEGTHFVPGRLAGYFNDLSGKTHWSGAVDAEGIPLVKVNGALQYFPVTTFQKGIGHWDLWLHSNRSEPNQFKAFEQIARWAVRTQDDRGGWPVYSGDVQSISPYSAMSQGQGASLLCRAYSATGKEEYLSAGLAAARLMLVSLAAAGTSRYEHYGIILEEYPLRHPRTVLNGWIFALYGLYDLNLVVEDSQIKNGLRDTLSALTSMLTKFNAGYWSFYDSAGALASPFYHRLHLAQLRSLQKTFSEYSGIFGQTAGHFETQLNNRVDRMRALVVKSYQKLGNPPPIVTS